MRACGIVVACFSAAFDALRFYGLDCITRGTGFLLGADLAQSLFAVSGGLIALLCLSFANEIAPIRLSGALKLAVIRLSGAKEVTFIRLSEPRGLARAFFEGIDDDKAFLIRGLHHIVPGLIVPLFGLREAVSRERHEVDALHIIVLDKVVHRANVVGVRMGPDDELQIVFGHSQSAQRISDLLALVPVAAVDEPEAAFALEQDAVHSGIVLADTYKMNPGRASRVDSNLFFSARRREHDGKNY